MNRKKIERIGEHLMRKVPNTELVYLGGSMVDRTARKKFSDYDFIVVTRGGRRTRSVAHIKGVGKLDFFIRPKHELLKVEGPHLFF